ncbi:DUF4266 domain-containing protein [Myxococcota bacterium]|nr:DUF4266 domain-containing protein [Myxococcota bacterium]
MSARFRPRIPRIPCAPCFSIFPLLRRPALLAASFALAAIASGCRTVEPWERAALAAPRMQDEPHRAHARFVDHVRQSREASAAGAGSSGGGCGCY